MLVIGGSAALALVTAFILRTRLPAAIVVVLLAAAGVGLAWGGMLLRDDPHPGEIAVAVVLLAVLAPAHVRIVLGPLGRRSPDA